MAWYCSRDCQLRQWKKHKSICAMFQQSAQEMADSKAAQENQSAAANTNAAKPKGKKKPMIQEL